MPQNVESHHMTTLKRPMRENKRLSDDMMEFIISQLKFKKADEALLDNYTKATVSHSNPVPLYVSYSMSRTHYKNIQDWLGGAQSKVGKWMRTADKDALTVNDRQKIKTVLSIMNKELK